MGLFDLFRKTAKGREPAPKKSQESLSDYSGLRVEALTETGDLLFVAKLAVSSGGSGELQLIGSYAAQQEEQEEAAAEENAEAAEVAPEEENGEGETEVKPIRLQLRGYDEQQQKAIHLEGDALHFAGRIWRVRNLRLLSKDNDRAFFRQDVNIAGEVTAIGKPGGAKTVDCTVLNISAGGACVQAAAEYALGDHLILRSRLTEGGDLTLFCAVRRVSQRRGGVFEYGCSFENLDAATEDMITRALLQLQMKRMRR